MVEPDFFVSCVDVAVSVAMPVAAGVKMPELPTVPALDGDTDHETPLLKLPVPVTEAVQVDVWFEKIEAGTQLADTLHPVSRVVAGDQNGTFRGLRREN